MASGFWISQAVYVAAHIKLADHLGAELRTAASIAAATGMHASSLHRLMRALTAVGILAQQDGDRFTLTRLGESLKIGAEGSARSAVLYIASQSQWQAWGDFLYSMQTGEPAFDKVLNVTQFEYLAAHPEEAAHFGETMVGFHGAEPAAVTAAYDFSALRTLVDVGGGTGNLITTILSANPHLSGRLFDMPHAASDGRARIERLGLSSRCEFVTGDFFENVPSGADAYLLSHVIHDWNEARCLTILSNCRRALNPSSKVLLIEMVLPAGNEPHPGKMLDLQMLATTGGQERTPQEYANLLAKASLQLTRVLPTASAVSIVEAVPA